MKERLFRDGDREQGNSPDREFDPISAGSRYGFAREVSLAIWDLARRAATDNTGQVDELQVPVWFYRIAARAGAHHLAPGRSTLVESQLLGIGSHSFALRAPGRITLVDGEALGVTADRSAIVGLVPGKIAAHDIEARRAERRLEKQIPDSGTQIGTEQITLEALGSSSGVLGEGRAPTVSPATAMPAVARPMSAEPASRALAPAVLGRMERLFGTNLRDVAVHRASPELGTATRGLARRNEVHLGTGERPGTPEGDRVLAHELAHVIQLRGRGRPAARAELEHEADRAAEQVARGQPVAVALSAGSGQYAYTDPGGNTIPDPIDVTWSSDPFHLEFRRDDSQASPRLVCTLRYTGPHLIDGPGVSDAKARTVELWRYIGTGPLKAAIRRQTATALEIDLYGDGTQIIRLADEASLETSGRKGRKHALEMTLNRASGWYGTIWVRDPAAKASDVTPAPDEDRPGMNPAAWYVPASAEWTMRLDGDGDQYQELEVRLKNITPGATGVSSTARRVRLTIEQLSTRTAVQHEFDLPAPTEQGPSGIPVGGLLPVIKQISDGGRPTTIDLTATIAASPQQLVIQQPERTATQTTYKVQAAGTDLTFAFPASKAHSVFGAGTAGVIGNIVNLDLTLGAYRDKFRLTIQPRTATTAVLGLSQVYRGQPTGGLGAELQLTGPVRFAPLLTSDTSLGLDLDGDGKPDLMMFDQLTTPDASDGGGPPEDNRNHQVRIVGTAVSGERTFTFRIRAGTPMREGSAAGSDGIAVSNALAVGELAQQQAAGASFDDQLDAYEATMMVARKQAVPALLSQATFDAWLALSRSMIKLRAQKLPVDPNLQVAAAAQADAFYKLIADETKGKATTTLYPHGAFAITNPYAASEQVNDKTTGAGPSSASTSATAGGGPCSPSTRRWCPGSTGGSSIARRTPRALARQRPSSWSWSPVGVANSPHSTVSVPVRCSQCSSPMSSSRTNRASSARSRFRSTTGRTAPPGTCATSATPRRSITSRPTSRPTKPRRCASWSASSTTRTGCPPERFTTTFPASSLARSAPATA